MESGEQHQQGLVIIHDLGDNLGNFASALFEQNFKLRYWCPEMQTDTEPNGAAFDLVISMGGNANPVGDLEDPWIQSEMSCLSKAISADVPVIGICLGAQLLAKLYGAEVFRLRQPEMGIKAIRPLSDVPIANAFQDCSNRVLQWHSFGFDTPVGCNGLATSDQSPCQMFANGPGVLGVQFHPEVTGEMYLTWLLEKTDVSAEQANLLAWEFQSSYGKFSKCAKSFFRQWLSSAGCISK